jgi:hypothetical protein
MGVVYAVDGFVDGNELNLIKINNHNNYYVIKPDIPNEKLKLDYRCICHPSRPNCNDCVGAN